MFDVKEIDGENEIAELRVVLLEAVFIDNDSERETPCVIEKWLDSSGAIHRPGGMPAVTVRNRHHGDILKEEYWESGQLHRAGDLPAIVRNLDYCFQYEWYEHGQLHRGGDQPARREIRRSDGELILESWHFQGQRFRPGGGLVMRVFDPDGEIWQQWVDATGQVYGTDGPISSVQPIDVQPG